MKISLKWLKEYIEIQDTPEELSEILTSLGLEVEGLDKIQSVPGGLEGLVIGQVKTCAQHPNADRLSLTTVDVGAEDPLQIVCGAPNVAAGQKVVIATVGTMLYPTQGDPFKIKKGKIRGEVSEGMICAEDEIGIGTDHDGIIVLPEATTVGTPAATHYQLEDDYVYDIGLTPNRSDATAHLGVARDLLAYYNYHSDQSLTLKTPSIFSEEISSDLNYKVEVLDEEACPRFSGIVLKNINIAPSPQWMQERLNAVGVRPINNIVDITNFVLHEFGQPLHAYDRSKIGGDSIKVQNLPQGTIFKSLDEKDRSLGELDLMVCDGNDHGMCIGGVFGGIDSGVTDATTEIFLEAAHFNPLRIRKTSTKHNLRTDAARCFEKTTDPNRTVDALYRAVLLMQQYAGAEIASQLVDIYPAPIAPKQVQVKLENVNRLIGAAIETQQVEKIFSALAMDFRSEEEGTYSVSIPTDKADVTREADVIEEILRIYGFNNVHVDNRINTSITPVGQLEMPALRRSLSAILIGEGYNEMMGLSLIPSKTYEEFANWNQNLVYINNTSNIHLDVMRPEMLLSGLVSIAHNLNRQQTEYSLFELGRSYQMIEGETKETELLAMWQSASTNDHAFFHVKKSILRILQKIGAQGFQVREYSDDRISYGLEFFRGQQVVAKLGAVSKKAKKVHGIKGDVIYGEVSLKPILKITRKSRISTQVIPKFPSSSRDISLVLKKDQSYQDVETNIKRSSGKLLDSVSLFDTYYDEQVLGEGKKSYALRLTFVDPEKSLKDAQLDKVMAKIIHQLETKMDARLR